MKVMSVRQIGQRRPSSRMRSAHVEHKHWCSPTRHQRYPRVVRRAQTHLAVVILWRVALSAFSCLAFSVVSPCLSFIPSFSFTVLLSLLFLSDTLLNPTIGFMHVRLVGERCTVGHKRVLVHFELENRDWGNYSLGNFWWFVLIQ